MTDATAEFGTKMAKPSTFEVDDVFWGYKIKSGRGPSFAVAFGQAASFFFGVCLLTASIGILALPTLFFDGPLGAMRIGSAALLGAAAVYLLWFASRGTKTEVHVDTSLGEIREVICNRAGRPTTVGSYGFDTIGGVLVEQDPSTGLSRLIMQSHNSSHSVVVAEGTDAQLMSLRDQLAHDLLGYSAAQAA
jgi:ABC-type nickel/cobalt efflux system permease component RcnA